MAKYEVGWFYKKALLVQCNQSTLSHHMKLLVDSGLVNARKDWKWVHYSINHEKLELLIKFLQ